MIWSCLERLTTTTTFSPKSLKWSASALRRRMTQTSRLKPWKNKLRISRRFWLIRTVIMPIKCKNWSSSMGGWILSRLTHTTCSHYLTRGRASLLSSNQRSKRSAMKTRRHWCSRRRNSRPMKNSTILYSRSRKISSRKLICRNAAFRSYLIKSRPTMKF